LYKIAFQEKSKYPLPRAHFIWSNNSNPEWWIILYRCTFRNRFCIYSMKFYHLEILWYYLSIFCFQFKCS